MWRFLKWAAFTIITLNIISFDVTYSDGLHIKSKGWPERLTEWWDKRRN